MKTIFKNLIWEITQCKDNGIIIKSYYHGIVDTPVLLDDKIVYDYPERLPRYIKAYVERVLLDHSTINQRMYL